MKKETMWCALVLSAVLPILVGFLPAGGKYLTDTELGTLSGNYTECAQVAANCSAPSEECAKQVSNQDSNGHWTCGTNGLPRVVVYVPGENCGNTKQCPPDNCSMTVPPIVCKYLQPCKVSLTTIGGPPPVLAWGCFNDGAAIPCPFFTRIPCS